MQQLERKYGVKYLSRLTNAFPHFLFIKTKWRSYLKFTDRETKAWVYRILQKMAFTSSLPSRTGPFLFPPWGLAALGVYLVPLNLALSKWLLWNLLNPLLDILFSSILQTYKDIKCFLKKFQKSQNVYRIRIYTQFFKIQFSVSIVLYINFLHD